MELYGYTLKVLPTENSLPTKFTILEEWYNSLGKPMNMIL